MPTSHPILLTPVAKQIMLCQPDSILDLGIGNGKWGVLAREYTDVWSQRREYSTLIDGVEIFEDYRNNNWEVYNSIYIGNIEKVLPVLNDYDMIIFLEVLEHIEKKKALEILNMCIKKSQVLLFSYTNSEQGDAFGNTHEIHLSKWKDSDFKFKKELLTTNGNTTLYKVMK